MTQTPNKPAWEERFENRYIAGDFGDIHELPDRVPLASLKAFIQETLASQRDELRKKIEEVLNVNTPHVGGAFTSDYRAGYDKAFDLALASLDSQDKPTN